MLEPRNTLLLIQNYYSNMSSFRPAKSTTEMSNVAHKSYYSQTRISVACWKVCVIVLIELEPSSRE